MVSKWTSARSALTQDNVGAWLGAYDTLHIDLGTGDGTYALTLARQHADTAVIGMDTCLDNLTKAARRGCPNLRFMASDATDVPAWLRGTATSISINFPFGSLLRALAEGDADVQRRLFAVAKPGARVDIRINGSAAKELGIPLEVLRDRLRCIRLGPASVSVAPHHTFRTFPSAWAKRLAYGRPSEVIITSAVIGM